jgi:hypothetical protein
MLKTIQKQLTAAEADSMLKQLDLLHKQMLDYNVSLNDDQRKGLRTMAEGREGFAKLVSDIGLTHLESLPRNENPEELKQLLNYYSLLSGLRLSAAKLLEMVDDTQTASGIDIMAMVDRYTAYLQAARKGNTALDAALNEVDSWNSRFGATGSKAVVEPQG